MKVLIIEDEEALNSSIVEYLRSLDYTCESVTNYRDALQKIDLYDYDCVILDIMLPDGNGLKLLQEIRAQNKADGVIIVSARNQLDDKLKGLSLGADDYLTKPFHLAELSLRIAAIVRRKNHLLTDKLEFEEISIDLVEKKVTVNEIALQLTKTEYKFLVYFIVNKNRLLSKNLIAEHLWGDDMEAVQSFDFMYAHIKNLRKKLINAGSGDYIHSVYGMGYKFGIS
ncbi:MAG: DNA-binding response regulator [Bacteroidetes bacterium 46-16]|nr:MAG: DNA-binding response regulator [Bacteroidetes bacterium 46-16]